MPLWVVIVGGWLLLSPVAALGVGFFLRRAAEVDDRQAVDALVPDALPHGFVDGTVVDAVVETAARQTHLQHLTFVQTTAGGTSAIPAPAPAGDDVLHLRLARPEA